MQYQYIDIYGDPFDVQVRTTADMLSTPREQLITFIDIARRQKWPVGLGELERITAEMAHLPRLEAPEAYVLVMTFGSHAETFTRYVEALRKCVELYIRTIDMESIAGLLQLNPICTEPKPGLAWWRINPDAHMPSLADEIKYLRRWETLRFCSSKCCNVESLDRPDLAHASVLAMALMHPKWRAVEGRLNQVRMGGYVYIRDRKKPSNNSVVELHRGFARSSRRRLYCLDLIWQGSKCPSPIPTASPVRFAR